jgi:putative effector of murein hydrolase
MSLLTVHKIFIALAIAAFVLLTRWEYANYRHGDGGALVLTLFSAATAVALALYLRWVWLRYPRSEQR